MIVFCTIDDLSACGDEERMEDCGRLLRKLISLTRRRALDGSCIFKLLVTALTRLRLNAVDDLKEEEILHIPEGLEKGGGFTDMKWEMEMGISQGFLLTHGFDQLDAFLMDNNLLVLR